ncbi:unnamed protein product [Ambrosiozyma monospora]|uniref:Unnamed protein product n=1 Tax=Ambrosiozyma monospora TaxID=43982 RepID=A0ACB5T9J0_AMBMO|nr:unnamed protein product [Ambrosiozyma monospora]
MLKYITTPRRLDFTLSNEFSLALRFGETRLSDLIHQNEFSTLEFKQFGMERIKKMGMSPDAFVQMSFQLAYYALYGKIESTYEPAMTKVFLHGRTEAIRTVSLQSNKFVTTFLDENVDSQQKIMLLKSACQAHSARTRECAKGLGQDRHLYALFCIWKRYFSGDMPCEKIEETSEPSKHSDDDDSTINEAHCSDSQVYKLRDVPSIFADGGWDKLNNTILSTSNCGNPSLKLFGFGPVSENGFGVGYIIKDNSITFCVSSKHRQTQRFVDTLQTSLNEMERVYIDSTKPVIVESESETEELEEQGLYAEDIVDRLVDLQLGRGRGSRSEITKLLGGYDSFKVDANSDFIKSREVSPEPPFRKFGDKAGFTSKQIGKKLRLAEY